jgi:hypothetical protein
MRFKFLAGALSLSLVACLVAPLFAQDSQPQQGDQRVIDDFVTTRGAGFGERPSEKKKPAGASGSTASARPQPKTVRPAPSDVAAGRKSQNKSASGGLANSKQASATKGATAATGKANKAPTGDGPNSSAKAATLNVSDSTEVVGLGYTVLLASEGGANAVVDSSREFVAGDKIRIALETNNDGFLYIFNAENDRAEPQMLYPHATLDNGANAIAAHARDFFPADLRYSFEFDDNPATEHLYIIFSRRALPDGPTGDDLLKFCGANREDCYWKPTAEQWNRIKTAAAAGRVVESRNQDLAKLQPPMPTSSLSRGIKVKKDEPAPAVVRMNASADADALLTKIEFVHK